MATIRGNIQVEATVPDTTAEDPVALAAAITSVLSQVVAVPGIDAAELIISGIRIEP